MNQFDANEQIKKANKLFIVKHKTHDDVGIRVSPRMSGEKSSALKNTDNLSNFKSKNKVHW